jgi:uncharacterized protein DUF29
VTESNNLYESDFYKWSLCESENLRHKRFALLDINNLAEEIESLGKRHRDGLESQLDRIMAHLLKHEFQPHNDENKASWLSSIRESRKRIKRIIENSGSLRKHAEDNLQKCYLNAIESASDETGMDEDEFDDKCPWTLDDLLNKKFKDK